MTHPRGYKEPMVAGQETLIVIPARYQSSRFPGKPLANLNGKPMIWHVVHRAILSKRATKVVVATDDDRIAQVLREFDCSVKMTSPAHQTGSDRVAEVASFYAMPLVLNLQGDLPLFFPHILDRLIEEGGAWIASNEADVVTLAGRIDSEEEFFSPHTVKLVCNRRGEALYFSRSPIPYRQRGAFSGASYFLKHYGVYLYSLDFLLKMAKRSEGDLERAEQLEQLRILEEGGKIRMVLMDQEEAEGFCEVNVLEDLTRANKMLSEGRL